MSELLHKITTERANPSLPQGSRARAIVLFFLFFSGFAGLVYEVLWLKTLQNVFGSTSFATATVFALFFGGLALGNNYWGKRSEQFKNPLRVFGFLELGIGVSALLYFILYPLYQSSIAGLFLLLNQIPILFVLLKILLASSIVFLPSFLMGGTIPVAVEYALRENKALGKQGSLYYAINTLGAATGAFLAGFYFPIQFGYQNSYMIAVATSLTIGCLTLAVAYKISDARETVTRLTAEKGPVKITRLEWLAFASGVLTLSLEVVWVHLFSQVLQNSVYTFSAVLVTFILALGLGSFVSRWLCSLQVSPAKILWCLLVTSGILGGISPFVFFHVTDGLRYLTFEGGWNHYIGTVFQTAFISFGIPVVIMGALLPYLLRVSESNSHRTNVGILLAMNTLGAVLGSLFTGFILIQAFGSWRCLFLIALAYFCISFIFTPKTKRSFIFRTIAITAICALIAFGNPSKLPLVYLYEGQTLVKTWEGNYGVISVVDDKGNKRLRANNHFGLGGYWKRGTKLRMADVPIMIHPNPESIFFEGMGTGVTAGASLKYPEVKKVVVAELVPEVITAARDYYSEHHPLFEDPRASIIVEDARNYLSRTPEKFDLIISDLFFVWHRGAGSLYSLEHFQNAKAHLNTGGLFVQWLPAYQFSQANFEIVAKTMLEVFPQITLWRSNFNTTHPLIALIGHTNSEPLNPRLLIGKFVIYREDKEIPKSVLKGFPFLFYAGNITAARGLFREAPINRDDHPYLEYLSPLSYSLAKTKQTTWFYKGALAKFFHRLQATVPPENDPYLEKVEKDDLQYIYAGAEYYGAEAASTEHRPTDEEKLIGKICARLGQIACDDLITKLRAHKKTT